MPASHPSNQSPKPTRIYRESVVEASDFSLWSIRWTGLLVAIILLLPVLAWALPPLSESSQRLPATESRLPHGISYFSNLDGTTTTLYGTQSSEQASRAIAQHSLNSVTPSDISPLTASSLVSHAMDHAADLMMRALSLIGVRYRHGGDSPQTGLDCSGLVRLVFQDALGMKLPRRAEEMSRVGAIVAKSELQPGDLVFYNTLRRTFSHVGIYLGEGRFIHAPASGGKVRIENMHLPYWTQRFNGARRVQDSN